MALSSSSRRTWIEIIHLCGITVRISVVLLAEDVDRNEVPAALKTKRTLSSSSRRTWIEIVAPGSWSDGRTVVLLAEDVDRNAMMVA